MCVPSGRVALRWPPPRSCLLVRRSLGAWIESTERTTLGTRGCLCRSATTRTMRRRLDGASRTVVFSNARSVGSKNSKACRRAVNARQSRLGAILLHGYRGCTRFKALVNNYEATRARLCVPRGRRSTLKIIAEGERRIFGCRRARVDGRRHGGSISSKRAEESSRMKCSNISSGVCRARGRRHERRTPPRTAHRRQCPFENSSAVTGAGFLSKRLGAPRVLGDAENQEKAYQTVSLKPSETTPRCDAPPRH